MEEAGTIGEAPPGRAMAALKSSRCGKTIWLVVAVVLCGPAALWAQAADPPPVNPPAVNPPGVNPPADDNARLNQLEAETQALRAEVQWLREHPVRLPDGAGHADGHAAADRGDRAAAAIHVGRAPWRDAKVAWKKGDFSITPYGYIWGNMVVSSERTDPGSYTLFVRRPRRPEGRESEFITDVRNTRLGFDVGGPKVCWFGTMPDRRRFECDFQNALLHDREQTHGLAPARLPGSEKRR